MRMEKYCALNIRQLWSLKNVIDEPEVLQYWILYQTCENDGITIRVQASEGDIRKINHVLPESLHCILFRTGKEYCFEQLKKEAAIGKIELEKLLVKKGFAKEPENQEKTISEMKAPTICIPKEISQNEVSKIIVHENGFLARYPVSAKRYAVSGLWAEDKVTHISICFRPNTKKLEDRIINAITVRMRVTSKNADYEQYFLKALEDEQKELNKEESLKLYDKLEEYGIDYMIDGGDTFIYKETGKESQMYYGSGAKKIKGKTARDMFGIWIGGKTEATLNKAAVLGVLE